MVTGGFTKNNFMTQMLANVLGREITVPENTEGSIAGAALIALKGCGLTTEYAFTPASTKPPVLFCPDMEETKRYADLCASYAKTVKLFQDYWRQQKV
jgi:sugar (pentulose or hexulose) kinase